MADKNPLSAIEVFDAKKHQFDVWLDMFELQFKLHKVTEADKEMHFLTKLGLAAYTDLRAMCGAKKPEECKFADLTKNLESFYNPKPSEVAERSKFRSRVQQENESLSAYVVEMQKLARTCNFGDNLQENLRDSIAHGVKDVKLKTKFFEDKTLTYQKVLEGCAAWEGTQISLEMDKTSNSGAGKNGNGEGSGNGGNSRVNMHRRIDKANLPPPPKKDTCTCCGKANHTKEVCRYRNFSCNVCSKKGHLESVCRSKKKESDQKETNSSKSGKDKSKSKKKVYRVEQKKDEDDGDLFIRKLYAIRTCKAESSEPTMLDVIVEDKELKMQLDNGADISCISEQLYHEKFKHLPLIENKGLQIAYDSHAFTISGYIEVAAKLQGNGATKLKLYVVKDGAHPLLGREWFVPLGIEVSIQIKEVNTVEVNNVMTVPPDKSPEKLEIIERLKREFATVFSNELGCYKYAEASLVLKEGAQPKFCRPRPLPLSLQQPVTEELERLVKTGKLIPVKVSDWGTPIVPVGKPNGAVRICGDYKITVNPQLVIDRFPLPNVEELFLKVAGSECFSTFDLSHAYQQIKLDEKSQIILTLSTLIGLLRPTVLWFGVASAPGIYQGIVAIVLVGIEFVAFFLDDIIVGGRNFEHHLQLCREVLRRLSEAGLTVAIHKCNFFQPKLKYLGFIVDKNGIAIDPIKIEAIVKAPTPTTKKEVQAFVGMIAYVIKFIPNAATVFRPLYDCMKKDAPEKITLTDEIVTALVTAKKLVKESPSLVHFDFQKPILLRCDASPVGIGGVLLHIIEGEECPIAYTSRTLTSTEKIYAQVDREALAIVYCVQKFDKYLFGVKFVIETDNSALTYIFGDKRGLGKVVANRVSRYSLFLRDYNFEIRHVRKEKNIVADGLSRLPLNSVVEVDNARINFLSKSLEILNREVLERETNADPLLNKIHKFVVNGWPEWTKKQIDTNNELKSVRPFYVRRLEISTEDNLLYFEHRVIVPKSLQKKCLQELHRSHLGIVKMKSIARSHFWWPEIDSEIEEITHQCKACCENRKNPPLTTLHKWKYPTNPGERIHADFGHFASKTFLLITDQYSKWVEIYWMISTTAEKTIQCFREYFARWGLVVLLVTDNGPPFSSKEFKQFLTQNGVNHLTSAPDHPRSNGAAEVMVGTVKNKLKKMLVDGITLDEAVNQFLLDYRTTIHATTGKTPAELHLNRKIYTRFDVMLKRRFEKETSSFSGRRTVELEPDDRVLVRQYRGPTKWVEGTVVKPVGQAMAEVSTDTGIQKRHKDQLWKLPTAEVETESVSVDRVPDVPESREETDEVPVRRSSRASKPVKRLIEEI